MINRLNSQATALGLSLLVTLAVLSGLNGLAQAEHGQASLAQVPAATLSATSQA